MQSACQRATAVGVRAAAPVHPADRSVPIGRARSDECNSRRAEFGRLFEPHRTGSGGRAVRVRAAIVRLCGIAFVVIAAESGRISGSARRTVPLCGRIHPSTSQSLVNKRRCRCRRRRCCCCWRRFIQCLSGRPNLEVSRAGNASVGQIQIAPPDPSRRRRATRSGGGLAGGRDTISCVGAADSESPAPAQRATRARAPLRRRADRNKTPSRQIYARALFCAALYLRRPHCLGR